MLVKEKRSLGSYHRVQNTDEVYEKLALCLNPINTFLLRSRTHSLVLGQRIKKN